MADTPIRDPFSRLRGLTQARIGLGRAGQGLPTAAMLAFQSDHARARDAVHAALDVEALAAALPSPPIIVKSAARDRATYLQNPDLGRILAEGTTLPHGDHDLAIVIGDGLSATAIAAHAPALIAALLPLLADWRIAPLVVARQARVALGDDIAVALGTRAVVMLIGERPGLSAADSLGAYLTWHPLRGTPDSARNCVSNIRGGGGIPPTKAADKIAWLLREARRLDLTGVALKDRYGDALLPPSPEHG